jgi:hypothetical protein
VGSDITAMLGNFFIIIIFMFLILQYRLEPGLHFRPFLFYTFPFILCESPEVEKRFNADCIMDDTEAATIGFLVGWYESKGGVFLWFWPWITSGPALAS